MNKLSVAEMHVVSNYPQLAGREKLCSTAWTQFSMTAGVGNGKFFHIRAA